MSKHRKLGTAEGLFTDGEDLRYQEEHGADLWGASDSYASWLIWAADLVKNKTYPKDCLGNLVLPKEYLT